MPESEFSVVAHPDRMREKELIGLPKDLFKLDDYDKGELAARVKGSGGLVRIYVHPFFYLDKMAKYLLSQTLKQGISIPVDQKQLKLVLSVYQELKQPRNLSVPTVIAEQDEAFEETQAWLGEYVDSETENMPYMLRTQNNLGLLQGHSFGELNSFLESIDAKSLELGGMNLERRLVNGAEHLDRCVGHMRNGLSKSPKHKVAILEHMTIQGNDIL